MKAIIKSKEVSNGRNYGGEKEMISAYSIIGTIKGDLKKIVTVRSYMGRSRNASTVYCSIWVHGNGYYLAGHGSAGGYGYHKESAALQGAINSAGIQLIGSPYADDKGMHYIDIPNPEFSPSEYSHLEALADADYAANGEAFRNYKWRIPATLRKLVKDTGTKPCHIGGCGEEAMRSAMFAIARAIGCRSKLLFVSH